MKEKLVRDAIPQILTEAKVKFTTRILADDEYQTALRTKLAEEVQEYFDGEDHSELVDVLEVILALAKTHGVSEEELMQQRQAKRNERGGFEKKIQVTIYERE